jgi:hypothetical protein
LPFGIRTPRVSFAGTFNREKYRPTVQSCVKQRGDTFLNLLEDGKVFPFHLASGSVAKPAEQSTGKNH